MKKLLLSLLLTIFCLLILGIYKTWAKTEETIDYQICGYDVVVCPGEYNPPIYGRTIEFDPILSVTERYSAEDIKQIIAVIADQERMSVDLLLKIAQCESGFDYKLRGFIDSRDRGLFQINSYHNPEVSDEQAFDPWFSTRWTVKEIKNGNIWKWKWSKFCWNK